MKYFLEMSMFCLVLWFMKRTLAESTPPNIVFIIADDMGWNDVAFHGSPQIPTPNIDALAQSGILLNNYYGHWLCTPSRAAFLSGRYPIRLGLQHGALNDGERSGLPLDVVTLPQHLKKFGYATHMIGKWHLGYQTKQHTPIHRGFDSFFGYWNSYIDHFDYTKLGDTGLKDIEKFYGIDLHNGTDTIRNQRSEYATDVFTRLAEDTIRGHNNSQPLFLYLAHIAVHIGNAYMPLQAPPKYTERVRHIKDRKRRIHAAMAVALDDSVGKVFKALHDRGMLDNTIVVFVSDNGGDTNRTKGGVSSNYPMRGQKETVWEGGFHLPALVWSPLLKLKEPRISKQLMHVTDWLPTLYKAAGGNPEDLGDLDGVNMWDSLINNSPSPRKTLLYNIDPVLGVSAYREGDMKLVNGTSNGLDGWYNPTEYECFKNGKVECEFLNKGIVHELLQETGRWILKHPAAWRKKAAVTCGQRPSKYAECDLAKSPCLFDLKEDPCEMYNLADEHPEVVDHLMKGIKEYSDQAVEPQKKPSDPLANPECHDFAYVPWLDPEYRYDCFQHHRN